MLHPNNSQAAALHQQAQKLEALGCLEEAAAMYSQAADYWPDAAVIHYNLGNACRVLGRTEHAVQAYRRAIACDPLLAPAYNNLGSLWEEQHDLAAAEAYYRRALELQPGYVLAHTNLGALCQIQNRLEDASHHFKTALEIEPASQQAHFNLGTVLFLQGQLAQSHQHYAALLHLNPGCADAYVGLGNILRQQGQPEQAAAAYTQALRLDPELAQAQYNLGYVLLLQGRLVEGFRLFEKRWAFRQQKQPLQLHAPLWQGEPLDGKTILLYGEQGFGDVIQFLRYIPLVRQRGGRVSLVCHRSLVPLAETVAGLEQAIAIEDLPGQIFDVCAFLMSLPHICGPDEGPIPGDVPYVRAPRRVTRDCSLQWQSPPSPLLQASGVASSMSEDSSTSGGAKDGKGLRRIGFVWASGYRADPEFLAMYRNKSCSLAHWLPLFELPGIEWYSLQVGERAKELYKLECIDVSPSDEVQVTNDEYGDSLSPIRQSSPRRTRLSPFVRLLTSPTTGALVNRHSIIDLSPAIRDFSDTAAIISELDLIITVDTAVAHLAGALAKPVWILLPYVNDWRWMLKRSDSPWYPTATLFRQEQPDAWEAVLAQVRSALAT